jgi:hypothetical protein
MPGIDPLTRVGPSAEGDGSIAFAKPKSSTNLDSRRLEIPVNDSALVSGFKRIDDLTRNLQCFIERDRTSSKAILERFAFDKLHDNAPGSGCAFQT